MNSPRLKAKRALSAVALVLPLSLVGMTLQEQRAQAQQSGSSETAASLPDGIYLYGETPQPEQAQQSYVVFEREQGKVVGAFYTPYSEFACFTGEQKGSQLEVKAVTLEEPRGVEATAQLNKLHPIDTHSENDQRILSLCKQEISSVGLGQL